MREGRSSELDDIALELPPVPDSAAAARAVIDELDVLATQDETRFYVRLLVSELVSNSIRHASLAPDETIVLLISVDDERLRVVVSDPGPGFEPRAREPVAGATSGWGLMLVDTLADGWGLYRDEGRTNVWFEIALD